MPRIISFFLVVEIWHGVSVAKIGTAFSSDQFNDIH